MRDVDHIIYATPDLEAGIDRIEAVLGVRAVYGGRHPGYGTRNALLALGPDVYLEIIGPDPAQPEPDGPRIFDIDSIPAPRLTAWAAKANDLEGSAREAGQRGVALGAIQSGGRETTDGKFLSWRLTDPKTKLGDGLVPFLIDWGETQHPARSAPQGCRLRDLTAEHPDAERIRDLLAAAGCPLAVRSGAAAALIATIDSPRGTVELR